MMNGDEWGCMTTYTHKINVKTMSQVLETKMVVSPLSLMYIEPVGRAIFEDMTISATSMISAEAAKQLVINKLFELTSAFNAAKDSVT